MKIDFDRGTRFGELFEKLRNMPPVSHVSREVDLTAERFHDDFAGKSRPFIISHAYKRVDELDVLSNIDQKFGNLRVKVRQGDYVNPENYTPEKRQVTEMALSRYFEIVAVRHDNAVPPYAGNFALPVDFLRSLGAGEPEYYPSKIFEAPTVWLGAAGCVTPLHRDSTDNFAIHMVGTKRWTIFPPQDAPFLYMSSVVNSPGGDFATSAVDLRRPDPQKFPLFAQARGITFDVSDGEILYLPMGWAHYVENLTKSLMVNYWLSVCPLGIAALQGKLEID